MYGRHSPFWDIHRGNQNELPGLFQVHDTLLQAVWVFGNRFVLVNSEDRIYIFFVDPSS
jgi:hypothetical protein